MIDTREELQALRAKAATSAAETPNPYWFDAYQQLAFACDRLDAIHARSSIPVTVKEPQATT